MLRILTFSTLYPSSVRPGHGIFVETRLRELVASGQVDARVIAPVPWFHSTNSRFGEYARMARTPRCEQRNGLDVQHPRYLLPPKIGMTIAPFSLALGAMSAVSRLIKEGFSIDLIDAHYYYPDGVAAAILAQRFNLPFTVTARGTDVNLIAKLPIPGRLVGWAAKRAHTSIGVSRALTTAMADLGIPPSKLITIANGVDLTQFQIQSQDAARAALGWPAGPTLLSVGNLVENKGHHLVIEALMGLPEFRLFVVGDGPERLALERLASKSGVAPRVTFLGRIDHGKIAACYSAADMLVLASSREGMPNVLLESMACGTPVVATAVGGIPEVVTNNNAGRVIPERTAAAIVGAVLDLWRNLPAREVVRGCAMDKGWQSTTEEQIRLFSSIAARAGGQTRA